MHHDQRWWHHWEEAGIALGALLVCVNLFAILTPYLSGPLFHPAWVIVGIVTVYVCAMMMAGGDRDQANLDLHS